MRRLDTTNKDLEYLHTTLAALCLQNAQQVNSAIYMWTVGVFISTKIYC